MINLYDFQIKAIEQMKNGCILCGDVGSGKSITALSYYYLQNGGDPDSLQGGDYIPMGDPPKDLYIITTARKRDTLEWEGEMCRFLLSPHSEVNLYQNKVVVDSWNNIKKYANVIDAFFIFDEQRVVGSGTWVKAFLKIARRNHWILLSATPGDTWQDYIPVFVANGFYRNKTQFLQEHAVYSRYTKYPKIDRFVHTGKLCALRNDILVPMDFHRGVQLHHEEIYAEFNNHAVKELWKTRRNPWTQEPIVNAAELYCDIRKIVNSDISRQVKLLEIFEDHPKLIVFYNFDYELDILRGMTFGDADVAEWNGHKHDPIPDGDSWVYLVQYTAGAEGLNCIATDTTVFYSQTYSYKVAKQAEGRINRMNTPFKDLYYYHLTSKSFIDIRIRKAYEEKRNFNANKDYKRYYGEFEVTA